MSNWIVFLLPGVGEFCAERLVDVDRHVMRLRQVTAIKLQPVVDDDGRPVMKRGQVMMHAGFEPWFVERAGLGGDEMALPVSMAAFVTKASPDAVRAARQAWGPQPVGVGG